MEGDNAKGSQEDSSALSSIPNVSIENTSGNCFVYQMGRLGYADCENILKNLNIRLISKEVPNMVENEQVYVYHTEPGNQVLNYWRCDGYQWKDSGSDRRPKPSVSANPIDPGSDKKPQVSVSSASKDRNVTKELRTPTVLVRTFHLLNGNDKVDFRRIEYSLLHNIDNPYIVVNYLGTFNPCHAIRAQHGNTNKQQYQVDSLEEELSDSDHYFSKSERSVSDNSISDIRPHRKTHPVVLERLADLQKKGVRPVQSYRETLLGSYGDSPDLQPRNKKQAYNVAYALTQKMACRNDIYAIYAFSHDNPGNILLFNIAESVDIVVSHKDMLTHVNCMHALANTANGIVCYNYDTTYRTGRCFASILSVRHSFFKEVPIIPVAILFHAYTDTESHKPLFAKIVEMIPAFNSSKTAIVTDREQSICNAIHQLAPRVNHFYCCNHILKNIADWVSTNIGAEAVARYRKQVKSLMSSNDISSYNTKLVEYELQWDPSFIAYYKEHAHNAIITSSKWRLEQFGLYSPESGITNNPAESANHMFKTIISHKVASLYILVSSVYIFQSTLLIDIHRGLKGEGEYHIFASEQARANRFPTLTSIENRISINKIPEILCDGNYVSGAEIRSTSNLGRNPSELGLAKYFIEEERILFVPKMKCFVVNGLGNRKQNVDIGRISCTCLRQGLCSHLLAVLISVGQDDEKMQKQILKRQSTTLNSIQRRTTPQQSGKKGETLSKRKPAIRERSTREDFAELDNSSFASDKSGDVYATTSAQSGDQVGNEMVENTDSFLDSALTFETTNNASAVIAQLKRFDLDQVPTISDRNQDDIILYCNPQNFKLVDVKSLQTKLKRAELPILSSVMQKHYTTDSCGYLEESIINAFLQTVCEGDDVVCFTADIVVKFFSYDEGVLPSTKPVALDVKGKRQAYNWDACNIIFMPHSLEDAHWQLIVAWPKEKMLTELNPAMGTVPMNAGWKNKLQRQLNLIFQFDMYEEWAEKEIEIASQTDTINYGVYVCYYAYMISKRLHTSLQIDPNEFRCAIMGEIMGGCALKAKRNVCCKCLQESKTKKGKILCVKCYRCLRLSHASCFKDVSRDNFVCPRT